jgi:UDP-GlcNAc:undecaprenyl-phosphate GlcNAc-1-phosphate transferase
MTLPWLDALYAFAVATAVAALLTPLTMRLARLIGAVDRPSERGLSSRSTPLLGGLAIFAAVLVGGLVWLPGLTHAVSRHGLLIADAVHWHGVLLAAAVITLVGAIDDRFPLHPLVKLLGQIAAAVVAERYGVVVREITLPLFGALHFPHAGPTLSVVWLVAMMNVVNFSDGVDGLAAGVCAIIAGAFAVIAFDLGQDAAGVLAALTAGASLGFLGHNFHPASSFMGDCGANLLGLLMGTVAVTGDLKTTASIAFALPLILLAVPFLDTTFVILKRLKYGRPVYVADAEHFHHRMARIGFSVRRSGHLPVRVDADARRACPGAALRSLQQPPWQVSMSAGARRSSRTGVLVVAASVLSRLRPRDREVPGPRRVAVKPPSSGRRGKPPASRR